MKIKAAVFDLDGLLIDSEPLWQIAEVEVLNSLGVPLTAEMCHQTVGLRIDEAIAYWFERYPWTGPGVNEVADIVVDQMLRLIRDHARAMPGAWELVEFLDGIKVPIAVATSSRSILAEAAIRSLGLRDMVQSLHSAQDLEHGKPHPGVYLNAASHLGVDPVHCVAFEDSINGVISAKAARMYCVAVPYPQWRDDPRFIIADQKLESLEAADKQWWEALAGGGE